MEKAKNFDNMSRKELASELYDLKKKTGSNLTPIGRKTPLTRQEFIKRYLNGIGGTKGFKKDDLIYLVSSQSKELKNLNKKRK